MPKPITVDDFVARYSGVQAAAVALGCTRATLWRWGLEEVGGAIPDPWNYKAAALMRRRPRKGLRQGPQAGAT